MTLPAGARTAPPLPHAPPPLPTTPVGRQLNNAYRAIVTAGPSNPLAAQNASFAYAQALQRARAGDAAGALAAAASAQAQALMVAPTAGAAPSNPEPPVATARPAALGVPIVENGPPLSADLLVARNEIEIADRLAHAGSLAIAERHYRDALDAYESGHQARSQSEARAAFDAAADAVSTIK